MNFNIFRVLKRNIAVFSPWVFQPLVFQHAQAATQMLARIAWHDDVVYETLGCSHERIGEFFAIFLGALFNLFGVASVLAKNDFNRSLWSHDGDFS